MMNTMGDTITAVLENLNQVTGRDFFAIQSFETGFDDAVAVIFIDKKNDKGFENSRLVDASNGKVQFFSVDNDRNIVDITPIVQMILYPSELREIKENIEKYGVKKGIQASKDNEVLTPKMFE